MSHCVTVQKLVSSYIEQSIDPESEKHIEQHLEACADCAKAVADIKFFTKRFKNIQPIKTSDDFDQKLRSRIIENRPLTTNTSYIKTMSYGLSTAVILVVVYWFINSDPTNSNPNLSTPESSIPAIQSAGVSQENAVLPVSDQEQKMAVTAADSTDSQKLSDEEKRPVNLVDQ
jgi:hypothetical protein